MPFCLEQKKKWIIIEGAGKTRFKKLGSTPLHLNLRRLVLCVRVHACVYTYDLIFFLIIDHGQSSHYLQSAQTK